MLLFSYKNNNDDFMLLKLFVLPCDANGLQNYVL